MHCAVITGMFPECPMFVLAEGGSHPSDPALCLAQVVLNLGSLGKRQIIQVQRIANLFTVVEA